MRTTWIASVLMVNVWLAAAGADAALAQGDGPEEATFVFRGTVTAAASSTLEQLPASDDHSAFTASPGLELEQFQLGFQVSF